MDILILDMPLLGTCARGDALTGIFIADLVLQLLSFVAQTERKAIRKRQTEGIAAAKARGVRFGRPPLRLPDNFESAYREWASGALSVRAAAQKLWVKLSSFYRYFRDFQQYLDRNGKIYAK